MKPNITPPPLNPYAPWKSQLHMWLDLMGGLAIGAVIVLLCVVTFPVSLIVLLLLLLAKE